jgi:ligand-binding sensor domain-containing protein
MNYRGLNFLTVLRLGILPVAFCLFAHPGKGQQDIIRFERFSDAEGLPSNLFTEVIQDRQGMLWMAGLDGLASYDGYDVTVFRHNRLDTNSISGNNISTVYEDAKGRLWLGIVGIGITVSDVAKSSFRKISLPPGHGNSLPVRIIDIVQDSSGRMWIASDAGLYIVTEQQGEFSAEHFMHAPGYSFSGAFFSKPLVLATDRAGNLWIGTAEGLSMIASDTNRMYSPLDFPGLPAATIQDIQFDRLGRLWISCIDKESRLYYTDTTTLHFKPFSGIPFASPSGNIQFTFDLDNRLWALVFGDQAYGYDFRDSMLFLQTTQNSDIPHERFFRRPYVDHSGSTWLPVEGFYIYPYPKGFNTYLHPFAFHQSNSCIYGSGDLLWFGYREKGLVRFDQIMGSAIHFSSDNIGEARIPVDHIQDVLQVSSGNFILVGFSNIAVMNPQGKIIASFLVNGTNRAAYQDSKGRIWIGGYHGLYLFSETKGVVRTYIAPSTGGDKRQLIQTIVEDLQGYIWFASDLKGLNRLDPIAGTITQFLPDKDNPESLPSISVLDIAVGLDGLLWLATDVALVKFDPVTMVMKSFGTSHGLENDFIAAIVCAGDGLIWMSTHSGIASFDPVKEAFINYSTIDGLSNYSFYTRSKYYAENGVIFFGGKNGVDYFHPSRLRKNPTAPRMFLSSVSVNNRPSNCGYDYNSGEGGLKLSFRDRLIELEVTGLHFADQEDVSYWYKMDGLDKDWIALGHQRSMLFSNLRPGSYVFRAKAMSGDGVWSKDELVLPLYIKPPFYATIWFRVLSVLLLLMSLYAVIRYRERAIKRQDKLEAEVNRKLVELERRALQAQMNPHFIYNSMNAIQQFMIIQDVEGAMKYLTKFSRILRTVLNISARSRIPLTDEITLITDYLELENMRFPDKFTYEIKMAPDLNIHVIEIPPFFIQPQVENAIRHGLLKKATQGHLMIDIKADALSLYIVVEDNGIGREASMQSKYKDAAVNESKGLAIVKERLSHMHPTNEYAPFKIIDLYDEHRRPAGTRVEIILPLD